MLKLYWGVVEGPQTRGDEELQGDLLLVSPPSAAGKILFGQWVLF